MLNNNEIKMFQFNVKDWIIVKAKTGLCQRLGFNYTKDWTFCAIH